MNETNVLKTRNYQGRNIRNRKTPELPLHRLPRIDLLGRLTLSRDYIFGEEPAERATAMLLTSKETMEIPDKIAYPVIVAMAIALIKMLTQARNFLKPKVPGNGRRLTLEELFSRLHGEIQDMRDVQLSGISTRLGQLENRVRAVERIERER